ncbi:MAG: DNA gyrase subunit A [Candidatus Marinimicrobia bacterium]|nr:DNA gyrase subunit A [Candidatus Neomarinimicrobiota bacterium]|tara:strand:+ start:8276 stop:10771 length:2496 start_codon:yes stop_codon:yes gene_type:complete
MSEELQPQIIQNRDIVEEMSESYLTYSMSVICSRALPDVRDGLKPVHRRVLYGALEQGATWNRKYKKSARIVGDVLGKYHPHGDSSIYDSLVRMAQDWSLRYPLIDGQGNFGSVDGDNAAAMRYTEARMDRVASEMLQDLDKNTVDFTPNFDDSLEEPSVLPTQIPNLLMNGSEGIAVGMATKIPPHNINELISGLVALLQNSNITIEELVENHIKGPDFPTAGFIMGSDGINSAYKTGRGRIVMRGKAQIEENDKGKQKIIITDLPYQVNKANLVEKIADLVREKKLDGISDLRDESDKDGNRIVIECKRDAIAEIILNNLYKFTQLQDTFGVIMLALVNGVPKIMNLKEVLGHFLDFRREVIIKRTTFELSEAEQRAHILEGLKKALEDIDNIIQIIRGSSNPEAAKESLISSYDFSDKQAKAILDMRLQKLTSLEIDKIVQEYNDLQVLIKELNHILESHDKQSEIIESELSEILNKHGDDRRTEIIPFSGELSLEDMIADEEMIVTITHNGYIKRLPADTWKTQRRGGKGMKGAKTKDDDFVEHLFTASTHNTMLFFTDQGKCHWLKVHQIPQASRTSQGRAIVNLIGCETGEKVSAFVSVKEFSDSNYIIMATKKGMINRTSLSLYSKPRKGGVFAMEIKEGDELIQAKISNGCDNIIMATREGKSIRFKEEDVRATGRRTKGVRGITIGLQDEVIGMLVLKNDGHVLVASENGYGKKSPTDEYRTQQRSGKGVYTLKKTQKTGSLVSILEVVDTDDIMIITSAGVMIRQATNEIRTIGRNTQGVRLIRLDEGAKISSVAKVVKEEEEEKEEENASSETKDNTAEE